MIFEILQDAISEMFDASAEDITLDTDFYDDLYADSLDMLELWYILEDEFDLEEKDKAKMEKFSTVGQVVNYISEK